MTLSPRKSGEIRAFSPHLFTFAAKYDRNPTLDGARGELIANNTYDSANCVAIFVPFQNEKRIA